MSKNKDIKCELKKLEKNLNIADNSRKYVIYENILDVIHEPIGSNMEKSLQVFSDGISLSFGVSINFFFKL